uniref:FGGY carbohydrate kinase domain-containing protein n=1 Tax=Cacopsylla melanoneura TaxID=428564 RepID=A0A8D8YBZ2_9HEMI
MDYLLSVDVGTSSVRAALVSARGKVGPIAVSPIQVWSPQPHFYQQSSEDIWQSVCKVVRDVTKAVNPDQIKGVGVDATCSLVALDSKHEPLTISPNGETNQNVILWMDHRAVDEATFINNTGHSVLDNVGGKISPEMETPKLLWLKTQLTESCWNKAGLFFDLPDFLSWKLTGDETRSLCSLVCKWTYDAHKRCWNENFFEKIGLIDLKQNQWRAIGMICGTSTCHMAMARTQVRVPGIWGPYYEVILANTYLLEGGQSSAGKLLEHIIDTHPATASIKIKLNTKELGPVVQYLNQVIETKHSTEMTAECHVWPDFHGNRSPLADPDMRGAIVGLTLDSSETNLVILYLATIQALAYGTRHILDSIHRANQNRRISTLLMTGGLAKNSLYVLTHADVTGCNLLCPLETECMLLGCGMLAAGAGQVYATVEEAVREMASEARVVKPQQEHARFHDKKYRVFLKLMETQIECRRLMQEL